MTKRILLILTFGGMSIFAGCTEKVYEPMNAAEVCRDVANDKKDVRLEGFINDGATVFCSDYSGRMDCGFDLIAAPGEKKILSVEIEQGSAPNMVEKLEKGYTKDDIKIRDSAGELIARGDRVKVLGTLTVGPITEAGGVCFLTVDKIER